MADHRRAGSALIGGSSLRAALFAALLLGAGSVAASSPPAAISDAGPEPQLLRIFAFIENNRLDDALAATNSLVAAYPKFRLGHLLMGDLLQARARPLTTFGDAINAPADRLDGLRDEAVARLKAYRNRPDTNYVPRYLMQMNPDQRYAVVVDSRRSRLYVYANVEGRPRFVADYYVTHGKAGTEKLREGDKKTPIGVYHVTASLPRAKLADLYGSGAYPINYPNEWDRRMGRNGHGIWLHGTPSDTFSRPPRASDGCVVLANQDLDAIAKNLQVGLTPVIISNDVEWLSLDDWQAERTQFLERFESWRKDWESGDIERYLSHYSPAFQSGKQDFAAWSAHKRAVARSKAWIKVETRNLSIFRDPGPQELVVVAFEQDYRSNNLADRTAKRQYWSKESGRWKIIYEGDG